MSQQSNWASQMRQHDGKTISFHADGVPNDSKLCFTVLTRFRAETQKAKCRLRFKKNTEKAFDIVIWTIECPNTNGFVRLLSAELGQWKCKSKNKIDFIIVHASAVGRFGVVMSTKWKLHIVNCLMNHCVAEWSCRNRVDSINMLTSHTAIVWQGQKSIPIWFYWHVKINTFMCY